MKIEAILIHSSFPRGETIPNIPSLINGDPRLFSRFLSKHLSG